MFGDALACRIYVFNLRSVRGTALLQTRRVGLGKW